MEGGGTQIFCRWYARAAAVFKVGGGAGGAGGGGLVGFSMYPVHVRDGIPTRARPDTPRSPYGFGREIFLIIISTHGTFLRYVNKNITNTVIAVYNGFFSSETVPESRRRRRRSEILLIVFFFFFYYILHSPRKECRYWRVYEKKNIKKNNRFRECVLSRRIIQDAASSSSSSSLLTLFIKILFVVSAAPTSAFRGRWGHSANRQLFRNRKGEMVFFSSAAVYHFYDYNYYIFFFFSISYFYFLARGDGVRVRILSL